VWNKDDWFPQNAGLALTMKNDGSVIFDNFNNDAGDFYSTPAGQASASTPGLYRGYSMSNNYDWIYAGYFKLSEETTIDEIIGYFDENFGFDSNSPHIGYRLNIWSNKDGDLLPAVNSFSGDVFSSDSSPGTFSWGDTGVDRVFGADFGNITDDIYYLTYHLDVPITLPAGEYWFSHDAIVTNPIVATPNPVAVGADISLSAVVTDENGDVDSAGYSLDGGTEVGMNILNNPYGYDALAAATLSISEPGVYNLCAYGKDSTGVVLPEVCTMVVVYDPSGGFVTGGGWIDSPEDAVPTIEAPTFFNGFETDTDGWLDTGGTITRVASGTNGVTSADGGWHAEVTVGPSNGDGAFTRFGGYSSIFPPGGFRQLVDVYIDPAMGDIGNGWALDNALNGNDGVWEEAGGVGALKATDGNWWLTADADGAGYLGPPGGGVGLKINTAGWYTIESQWVENTTDPSMIDRNTFIYDSAGTLLYSNFNLQQVALADAGGHRYGWFLDPNGPDWPPIGFALPIDNSRLVRFVGVTGKASFGFVSKYKKGASTPTGSTEFQFKAGNLNFHSDSYEWLLVTGGNFARYKGEGTINGGLAPNGELFKFMLWAGDGTGPSGEDTFRIKIWYEVDNVEIVVYDNGMNQPISGGSIVVHTKKK
jgi:hypothetical protein